MRLKDITLLTKIRDKVEIGSDQCCPPHYWPHKLVRGEPVTDEPCHIHENPLRMAHHIPFCYALRCPHYRLMMDYYKAIKNNNNSHLREEIPKPEENTRKPDNLEECF